MLTNIHTIFYSILGAFIVSLITSNIIIYNKLDSTKDKLSICSQNQFILETAIENQNKKILEMKAESIPKIEFDKINKKYQNILYSNTKTKKELETLKKTKCEHERDIIQEGLNEFFKN